MFSLLGPNLNIFFAFAVLELLLIKQIPEIPNKYPS